MTSNRSHSRYMRRGRFARLRYRRGLLDFLSTQHTRLAASASAITFSAQIGVGTYTGDGTNLANTDTVTIGSTVYTIKTTLTEAKAVGTLTNDGSNVTNGDTVTIGTKVYTFQDTLTDVDGHVKIGASNTASMTNLFHAINATGGTVGTDYATSTVAHTLVTATNPSGTTVVVTAKTIGTAGNAIASTETSSHLSWGAALLASGADSVAGEVLRAGTAAATLTNLFHAINATGGTVGTDYATACVAHTQVTATNPSGTTVVVTAKTPNGTAFATTTTATHGSWGAASAVGDGNKLTATSHGLTDNEGPFNLFTTVTLPAPLNTTDLYYVRKVDANTIKVALSLEALELGAYETLSANGSGTHTMKRATSTHGIYDLMRKNKAEAIKAATDIDSLA